MPLSYPEAFELLVELHRSSHRRCSKAKGILHNSREKIVLESLFNKVVRPRPATLSKVRRWYRCFPMNFTKLLRRPILKNICKRLLLFGGWRTTYKLNRGDLLLLSCLVYINISVASFFFFFTILL